MRLAFPARHIQADFADDGLGHADIDAVDPGQVDAADAVQFPAQVKLRAWLPAFRRPFGARAPRLSSGSLGRHPSGVPPPPSFAPEALHGEFVILCYLLAFARS